MLYGWDVLARGPEAIFICDVADRYGRPIWANVGIESFLDNHSFPVIIRVQQCALLADRRAVLV